MTPLHVPAPSPFKQKHDAFAQLISGIRFKPQPKPVEQRVLNGKMSKSNSRIRPLVLTPSKTTAVNSAAVVARFEKKRRQFNVQLPPEEAVQFQRNFGTLWNNVKKIAKRRISYTREAKLDAINYTFTIKSSVNSNRIISR